MSEVKVSLLARDLYVVRSVRTKPDKTQVTQYYMTVSMWNTAPVKGTIFTCYEAAEAHMKICHEVRAPRGWHDGSKEIFDVVPLYTEILKSPNGMGITVKQNADGKLIVERDDQK